MSELQRVIYEVNKLRNDGINALDILKTNNVNNYSQNHALNVFKNIERFLSDKKLVDLIYRENRRLYNDIIQIYEESKKRIRNLEDLTFHNNQNVERKIDTLNGLLNLLRQLFNYDISKINGLSDKLDKISLALNYNRIDTNNISKELYNQYMKKKQVLLRTYETFKEYMEFLNYIKTNYDYYQKMSDEKEKSTMLNQIVNRYQFIKNKLSSIEISSNIDKLEEVRFFMNEYKKMKNNSEIKPTEALVEEKNIENNEPSETVSIEQLGISRRVLHELEGFYSRYAIYLKKPYTRNQQILYLKELSTILENRQLYEVIENMDVTNLNKKDLFVITKMKELIEDMKEMDLYPEKKSSGK